MLLDTILERFTEKGFLSERGTQRSDSSQGVAAIRVLNSLGSVRETFRHALNSLAVAAPDWLAPQLDPAWADRYGPRFDEYRLPKKKEERQALADQIGKDGFRLLGAVSATDAPPELRKLPAVETLRQVWRAPDEALVLPLSSTGTSAMEAGIVNLLAPGETMIVAQCGFFGRRIAEIGRMGLVK